MLVFSPIAYADSFQDQINALSAQVAQQKAAANNLQTQANTLQGELSSINAQVGATNTQLQLNRAKQADITQRISDAQAQLATKKEILNESLRSIYHQSQISPIEMLASSKNFSDYVDKQQYQDQIKDHIQQALAQINQLKAQLEKQQTDLNNLIGQQSALALQLAAQQARANQLLADTKGQQSAYESLVKANASKIDELKSQQAAALAAQYGRTSGNSQCGGGYPWCGQAKDAGSDDWGMGIRECVSYTAFRVANSGRYMPKNWVGYRGPNWYDYVGNAKYWPEDAQRAGIPYDHSPRPGDVAISTAGQFGHAMYVERVNSNGTIDISQYNAENQGLYSTNTIPTGGLWFIHF